MAIQNLPVQQWPSPDGTPCIVTIQYDDTAVPELVTGATITKQASYRPTLNIVDDTSGAVVFGPTRLGQGATLTFNLTSLNYHLFRDSENQIQFPFQFQFA